MAAGVSDSMAWVVDEDSGKVVWWRYRQHAHARQLTGRVSIHACARSKLRALVAYDVKTQASDQGADVESFLLVAYDDGLETVQLTAAGSVAPPKPHFKSWQELQIERGSDTVLCVEAEDDHSNVMLSNRPWELVVFRHDLTPPEGPDSPAASLLDVDPEVFDQKSSRLSRLGMGNISLGNTLRRLPFMGSEPSAACARTIMCTRVAPTACGRRAAGPGRSLISVTVLSQDDVYVWRLAFVSKDRFQAEGYLRLETCATRARTALGVAVQDGSLGAAAASQPLKQVIRCARKHTCRHPLCKCVGMCMCT